jgi:2-C-methyl-D-erythritol 2,4-cyclodiphosphate synthase
MGKRRPDIVTPEMRSDPLPFEYCSRYMNSPPGFRTGIGYDVHRTALGCPLVLGGVRIPAERGLIGHSDADVVLHAICDALLGAAGLGDIGELFPDSDPRHRGADSREFVREVVRRLAAHEFSPVNVDVMILAEQPRLAPHKSAMQSAIAALLAVEPDAVGVKAGTNEGLDAIGRGEAIGCIATALIRSTS